MGSSDLAQVEFSEFVRAEGFDIIAIPEEEQLNYGCILRSWSDNIEGDIM